MDCDDFPFRPDRQDRRIEMRRPEDVAFWYYPRQFYLFPKAVHRGGAGEDLYVRLRDCLQEPFILFSWADDQCESVLPPLNDP